MGFGKQGTGMIFYDRTALTALGTLGLETAIFIPSQYIDALVEDVRLIKIAGAIQIEGMTALNGPIIAGICNGELTVGEVAEAFLSEPKNTNDRAALERSQRAVFPLVVASSGGIVPWGDVQGQGQGLSSGAAICSYEKTLRWTFANPDGWNYFVINMGAALDTGAQVQILGKHFGVWVT